jgi:hypothetical protein
MDVLLASLNTNKIFTGLAMLVLNLGSRYIIMDIGAAYDKVLSNVVVKQIVVFCMFFASTRDVKLALILTFGFWFIVMGLLDKKRPLNVMPSFLGVSQEARHDIVDFTTLYANGVKKIL